jgi:hypothetical protein
VINCPDSFRATINNTFGRISPEDCFISGDAARCRINALLCNNRKDAGIYLHSNEREEERIHIAEILKGDISSEM